MSRSKFHYPNLLGRLSPLSLLAIVAGFGGSYWLNFIWFYLKINWQTTASINLLFNAGFGFFYIIGCVVTGGIARRLGPRVMLLGGFLGLIILTAISSQMNRVAGIGIIILIHAFVITWTWPNLEMLMARGKHGPELSRALSGYNLTWAGTSALAAAIAGKLYAIHPSTLFIVPIVFWFFAVVLVARIVKPIPAIEEVDLSEKEFQLDMNATFFTVALDFANLMKLLSRTGNMACYLLISTLVPTMPTITARLNLTPAQATAFASAWMIARVVSFLVLRGWHGWHYKLRLFLAAILLLPISFVVVLVSHSILVAIAAQLVLGFALGLIYTSSLYYSMHGKPEASEAAIHEAVIGVGIMVGPLISALASYGGEQFGFSPIHTISIAAAAPLMVIGGWMMWRARRSA